MAELTREEKESLANVPSIDDIPEQVQSVLAWQAKTMPELFNHAFPDAQSLQLRDRVWAALMAAILSGRFNPAEPGALASESNVAESLPEGLREEASGTPLLEALALLVRDGFVVHIPEKGFEVAEISANAAREALSLCGEVEAQAVERLIASDQPRDVERLRSTQQNLTGALEDDDRHSWMLWDTKFHAELARITGLEDAFQPVKRWRQKVHLYSLGLAQLELDGVGSTAEEHDVLISAITDRPGEAVRILEQHLEHTADLLGLSGT